MKEKKLSSADDVKKNGTDGLSGIKIVKDFVAYKE